MGWIRLRNNMLVYLNGKLNHNLYEEFSKMKKWTPAKSYEYSFDKKYKQEFVSYKEAVLWKHFESKDETYKDFSYQIYAEEDAKTEIYEWLWAFCETHSDFSMGKMINGYYSEPKYIDANLEITFGKKFLLFMYSNRKKGLKTEKQLSNVYSIDVANLFAIIGTLNNFYILFKNGLVYQINDSNKADRTTSTTVLSFYDNRFIYRILNDLYLKKHKLIAPPRIPLPFESFIEILKNYYEIDDYALSYEVEQTGYIELYRLSPYGKTPVFTITPQKEIININYEKQNRIDIKEFLINQIVELTDLPEKSSK